MDLHQKLRGGFSRSDLESFKNITDPAVPISSLLGVCAENQWKPSELLIDKMRVFSPNIDQKLHIWPAKVIIPKLLFSDPEVKIGQEACKKSRDMIAKEDLKSKKLEILSTSVFLECSRHDLNLLFDTASPQALILCVSKPAAKYFPECKTLISHQI